MKPAWRWSLSRFAFVAGLISVCAVLNSQRAPRDRVGPLPDGGFLLNSFWRVAPVGRQVPLDTLPMSTALSPDGRYLLALNGGYNPPSVTVLDAKSGSVLGNTPVPDGWLGLAFSPRGDRLYVGGGSQAAVFEFAFADGKLTARAHLRGHAQGQARRRRLRGRRSLFSRRAPALRRRAVPQRYRRHQPAIGHGDQPLQDRPPAVPHRVPSRRPIVFRFAVGGRLAWAITRPLTASC